MHFLFSNILKRFQDTILTFNYTYTSSFFLNLISSHKYTSTFES